MAAEQNNGRLKIGIPTFLAHVYFFFNSVFLPAGLLYTQLIGPVLYLKLLLRRKRTYLFAFILFLSFYDCIHLLTGVDYKSFAVSNILFVCTYCSVMVFYHFIKTYRKLPELFYKILLTNAFFTVLALITYFTSYRDLLWYKNKFTHSVDSMYRLALLTYEASYYSLLLVPLVFYFLLKLFHSQIPKGKLTITALVLTPMIMSLSIGVISAMLMAFCIYYLLHWEKILTRKSFFWPISIAVTFTIFSVLLLILFFPENPLFTRISNIFNGIDTSTNGRTSDSFKMAWMIAERKSLLFGAGLGQIKIVGAEIQRIYFWYWGNLDVVRIPNTTAETLAIFGFTGILFRFSLIAYLFFKTKVWNNHFRFLMFCFIFIYQFTGSFIINIVEYTAWIFAFVNCFPELDVAVKRKEILV